MTITQMQNEAESIQKLYAKLNKKNKQPEWTGKDFAMGFAGDFGDLLKLTMAKENVRIIDDFDKKMEHEIADCLWSILVLSKYYNIDIEKAFNTLTRDLTKKLNSKLEC